MCLSCQNAWEVGKKCYPLLWLESQVQRGWKMHPQPGGRQKLGPWPVCAPSLRFPIHLWVQQAVELQGALAWLFFPGHRYKGCPVNSVLYFLCNWVDVLPWPSLRSWLAGGESGSGWRGDRALCRVLWGESSSLPPSLPPSLLCGWEAIQHSPHCCCDSGSHTSWGRSSCPHTKIVTKLRGMQKCSHSGQPGWFCSPSVSIIIWDQSLPARDSVYIHYNVIIWYRDLQKSLLSPGGFLLSGRNKVSSENAITLLSLYMPTASQSPFWSLPLSPPSAHLALHLLKQQVTSATPPIRAYYAMKLHCF